MNRGRLGVLAAVAVALLVVVSLWRAPSDEGPYDLRGTGPDGLGALAQVLERAGVSLEQGHRPPDPEVTRVLVPQDLLRSDDRRALLDWVRAGGVLVVADPESPLHGLRPVGFGLLDGRSGPGGPDCDLPAFADVAALDLWRWPGLRTEDAELPAGARIVDRCFPVGADAAWATVLALGRGHVIALASLDPLVNRAVGDGDHTVLGAVLLGPRASDRLLVLEPPPPGTGERTVLDLLPARVWSAGLLGLAALVAAAVWRGRRLGAPVAERLPPVLPSAELARSIGDLLHRADGRDGAAARLRQDTRRHLVRTLGLPANTPPAPLAEVAAARLDVSRRLVESAILDTPVRDEDALVEVAEATARVRAATTQPTVVGHGPPRPDEEQP